MSMPLLTVGNLSADVLSALRTRAAKRGHSVEAEVRDILEAAVRPRSHVQLGSLLADIGRRSGLNDEEYAVLERVRERSSARKLSFE